jgi:hypothetical protein
MSPSGGAGKAGVTWLTMTEMDRDLDFNSTGKLRKYVDQLVADGWIVARRSSPIVRLARPCR